MIIRIPSIIEIGIIIFYQKYISKYLGSRCRFYPTCSEYARQAIDKYGIIKGNVLLILRILKCHPFSKGGIDYLK
ncbi:MAG: membrane protein insertion efficiency factor YidD [Clostridia bacterium]|nr:membrane protein insertion efficiency factor YidD [Clostridia bacterium]